MITHVLDACAVLTLTRRYESGHDIIKNLIKTHGASTAIHALNLCEVYKKISGNANKSKAEQTVELLERAGVTVIEELPAEIWKDAAWIQTSYSISMADSIAWATARFHDAILVTADKQAFEGPKKANVAKFLLYR